MADEIVGHFLPSLCRRLAARYPRLAGDPELDGCALAALVDYLTAPARFDPERGSLWGFLYRAAWRNAATLVKSGGKIRQQALSLEEDRLAGVPDPRNEGWDEPILDHLPGLPDELTYQDLWDRVLASVRPDDRPMLDLVMQGETDIDTCVAVLRLDDLPANEGRRLAKLSRDRVHAAIRRVREWYAHE